MLCDKITVPSYKYKVSGTFFWKVSRVLQSRTLSLHEQYTFWIYSSFGRIYLKSFSSPDKSAPSTFSCGAKLKRLSGVFILLRGQDSNLRPID